MSEYTEITKPIINYLNSLNKCYAIKIHSGLFQNSGIPDILCCFNGKLVVIECKKAYNRLSELQKKSLKNFKNANAICLVVYSLLDLKIKLKENGII